MGRLAVATQLVGLAVGDAWAGSVWGRPGALGFGFVALMFLGYALGGADSGPREVPTRGPRIVDPGDVRQPSALGMGRRLLRRPRRRPPVTEHMPPRSEEETESWTW